MAKIGLVASVTWMKNGNTTVYAQFWVDPLQTTTCGTPESKESTARVLCLSRRVEWITRVEQCGLLRFWCATGGSLQRVLAALRINSVTSSIGYWDQNFPSALEETWCFCSILSTWHVKVTSFFLVSKVIQGCRTFKIAVVLLLSHKFFLGVLLSSNRRVRIIFYFAML